MKKILLIVMMVMGARSIADAQCTPGAVTCTLDDRIDKVVFAGINNANNICSANGYGNYTAMIGNPVFGNNAMSVTVGPGGTEYVGVWIDYDHNSTFDASEFTLLGSGNGVTISGNINIPTVGVTAGNAVMRVRVQFNQAVLATQSCTAASGFGEVEDYTVNLPASAPCAGTPAPGNTISSAPAACPGTSFTLSTQNITPGSGVTYQWQSSPTGVAGSYTNIGGATNSTYTTTLTASTYYQVRVTCGGNTGVSTPTQVTLTPPSGCYCIPGTISCASSDVITNVTFAGINNTTACSAGGYGNYTVTVPAANVTVGSTTPITVTVGPGGTEYVGVWIDYNQNGTFETTEFKLIGSANGATISNTIDISPAALTGVTRMRVRVQYNTAVLNTQACAAASGFGEVEDYNVNIQPCVPATVTTAPPAATSVACGGTATITATIGGSPSTYLWQVQTTAGGVWTNLTNAAPYSGVTTNTLTINPAATTMNGYNYRLIYSNGCTGTSFTSASTLTVTPIAATFTQTPAALCATGTTSQTIAVTGGGTGIFTPNGTGSGLFTDAAHTVVYTGTAVTTVYAFPAATATYTLVRTNGACVSTPATVTVTVNTPVAGTPVLPAATAICANGTGTISFTGITAGTGLTYQWQVNTIAAPATFTNVTNGGVYSGATTAALTITNPTAAMSGLQYHVIVSSVSCASTVTSNNTTLTVNPVPVVVLTAAPTTVASPTSPVTLTATVSSATAPLTYQWYLNNVAVAGATGATFTPDVNAVGDYSVTVKDANGCGTTTSTPISITVTRGASDMAFIYPSPNSGTFQVRYYNATATATQNQAAMVNVYDQKGSRIFTQRYVVTGPYTQMKVNLGTHSRGIYRVEISDANGNRLNTGTVMVF